MFTRQANRRRFLGALAALVTAIPPFGAVHPAGAKDNARPRPDYGSKGAFKAECELLGGTYSKDRYGNTNCRFPDGTWIQCDANGNDCWITDAARPQLPGGQNVYDGSFQQVAASDGGTQPPDPAADDPSLTIDHGAAPADNRQPMIETKYRKRRSGRKRRRGRRRH